MDVQPRRNPLPLFLPINKQLRIMADAAPVMIWMSGIDKRPYYFNLGWLTFTGKTLDAEIHDGWEQNIHPGDREQSQHIRTMSFDARKEFKIEYRLKRHDGVYRWILDNGVPRYTHQGQFSGYIGSCIDIQNIKDAENKRQEFINLASHELKTPLTSLKLYIDLMNNLMKTPDTVPQRYLRKMSEQVDKLTKLVGDLLDISKLESGKLELSVELFDIHDTISALIETAHRKIGRHPIILRGTIHQKIRGDNGRIGQIILHLLQNAAKYSSDNTEIIITVKSESKSVVVAIQDFGIGIAQEHVPKIFTRFYRVDQADGENTFPGMGVGLYFASEVIKKHGGKMWADSEEGKGTIMYVSLPIVASTV